MKHSPWSPAGPPRSSGYMSHQALSFEVGKELRSCARHELARIAASVFETHRVKGRAASSRSLPHFNPLDMGLLSHPLLLLVVNYEAFAD